MPPWFHLIPDKCRGWSGAVTFPRNTRRPSRFKRSFYRESLHHTAFQPVTNIRLKRLRYERVVCSVNDMPFEYLSTLHYKIEKTRDNININNEVKIIDQFSWPDNSDAELNPAKLLCPARLRSCAQIVSVNVTVSLYTERQRNWRQ